MAFGRVSGETRFILDLAILLARAAVVLGWIQIQLDLTDVRNLWFFQATLRGLADGESRMRLCHDGRVLPPAQPGPEGVTRRPFRHARCFVSEPQRCFQKHAQASVE